MFTTSTTKAKKHFISYLKRSFLYFGILLFLSGLSCSEDDSISLPRVTVSEVWTSGFNLDWKSEKGQLQIELSLDEGFEQIDLDTLITKLSANIEGLRSGSTYFMRYKFVNGNSLSGYSAVAIIETPELLGPQNVSASKVKGDEIQLNWTEFRGANFEVQVSLDQNFTNTVNGLDQLNVYGSSIVIEPLSPLTTYFVRVRCTNQGEESEWFELDGITTSDLLTFELRSDDFINDQRLPFLSSCEGGPPELNWKNAPEGTMSYAITMIDLDFLNGYNHWIIFNIPGTTTSMPRGSTRNDRPPGSTEGTNGGNDFGYFGPCPPAGETHRYVFTLYALDKTFDFLPTIKSDAFLEGIESSTLEISLLKGTY